LSLKVGYRKLLAFDNATRISLLLRLRCRHRRQVVSIHEEDHQQKRAHNDKSDHEDSVCLLVIHGLPQPLLPTASVRSICLAIDQVQRIGEGWKASPFLYFAAGDDSDREKRELADGHAIENTGRHLRGGR
jgi:hypothetical protein